MTNSNGFKSVLGSDHYSVDTPSSDHIISCSANYYKEEHMHHASEENKSFGYFKKLNAEQRRKDKLEMELDAICSGSYTPDSFIDLTVY